MRIAILSVGRLRPPFTDDIAHYRKLLSRYCRLELTEERDEQTLVSRIPESTHLILLDRGGKTYDSTQFADWLEQRRQAGRDICFIIGGAFGIEIARCDERLSFGPLTLPHQLARVVLLEQLYRAHKILAGEPYHY